MKAFRKVFLILGLAIIAVLFFRPLLGAPPEIRVVYPKSNAIMPPVDSTFILGSATPGSKLKINGIDIPVYKDGGWIAFLPIESGRFFFQITAEKEGEKSELDWPINVQSRSYDFGFDSLYIVKSSGPSRTVSSGERLKVGFYGTPSCRAYFSIPGLFDSIPMAEIDPDNQVYWGEITFGAGEPIARPSRGYYAGYCDITLEKLADSTRLIFNLVAPDERELSDKALNTPISRFDFKSCALLKLAGQKKIDSSDYFIRINPPEYPRVVEFTDSMQIIRIEPSQGYFALFQPRGVLATAIGEEGDWLKLRLSATTYGWIKKSGARFLESGRPPVISYPKTVRAFSDSDRISIEVALSAKHPFRVEEADAKTIILEIFGANSNTDWIKYDFNNEYVEIISWSQPEPERYRLTIKLNAPFWGYDAFYDGNILKLRIKRPPERVNSLKNKVIVVDPGHSSDPGAIGPTGLTEAEANLNIALALKKELERKGAFVIMTRADMSHLSLYDRPAIAVMNNADLFVSIHNNALPDGVNPFINNGVSTYYYHPHSIELAKSIQRELIKDGDLNNYGLYYGNLAVNRPTQYPAALVECAFIILPEHEALLKTTRFQNRLAKRIGNGIERFFKNYEQ
jgi:N-acetylmuramoyl-L-alanine amidase